VTVLGGEMIAATLLHFSEKKRKKKKRENFINKFNIQEKDIRVNRAKGTAKPFFSFTLLFTSFLHLLRKFISTKNAETLIHAFITSRLDNCNSLLYGLPNTLLDKLQYVQNSAARLLTLSKKHDHITPILFNLHWLPINYRIKYKILLFTFKALHGLAPSYIGDLISRYKPGRSLRSSNELLLTSCTYNL